MTCKRYKPFEDFAVQKRSKDGRQPSCRSCQADYFAKNREKIVPGIRARTARVRVERAIYVWEYLLEHPCVDCGEPDPIVLEFDHVRGVKQGNISKMIGEGVSLKRLQAEIDKCEVRCANCHRRRTASSLGWYAALEEHRKNQPPALF